MKLQCKNAECESRNGEASPAFDVHLTVDEEGSLAENPKKIDGEHFTCCFCQDSAEWVEESC